MKSRIELAVEPRNAGKHFSRSHRNKGEIPAVVYGAVKENANIFLQEKDIKKYNTRAYENALFVLKGKGTTAADKVVLMKSVSVHPLSRRPVHVDLFAIDPNKAVRVFVEVVFDGKPIGLSEGGLMNVVNRELEIEVKPDEIPENFKIDVSNLGVGDALHVSDLQVGAGVKIISPATMTLVVVNLAEEEAATPAAAAAAAPAAGAAAPAAAAPAAGAAKSAPAKDDKKK